MANTDLRHRLMAILAADAVGYSHLMATDESATVDALDAARQVFRHHIDHYLGRVVDTAGDSVLAVFDTASGAVDAALAIQQQLAAACVEIPEDGRMRFRIGIHLGDVIVKPDGSVYGNGVNVAARLQALGEPGGISVSEAVRSTLGGRAGRNFDDQGQHRVRNIAEPVHAYGVSAARVEPRLTERPLAQPIDSIDEDVSASGKLPRQLTSFVGRKSEVAEVSVLLETSRLVTLLGTGGLGKTRLMLAVAGDIVGRYPDGVWFVDLSPMADPGLVTTAVARALNVTEEAGTPLLKTLCDYARSRRLLLLLDNCEHLLEACAKFADEFLRSGSGLTILATSRESLCVEGEQAFPLAALTLPHSHASVDEIGRSAAVQLFVERARQHEPRFTPSAPQVRAVGELCIRLEGIPLALELAAARIRVLSVEQILDRLDDRLQLLTSSSRSAPARHQTLRATIDWSYELLNASEKPLLCRLAIFAGGWTLDAAQQVCASEDLEPWAVFDGLAQLVHKSLVVTEERGGSIRYRLLESVRLYALERLRQGVEEASCSHKHLLYFLELAEESEAKILTADQQAWLDRLEAENDNLRAALAWSLTSEGNHENGLRLAGALRRFWSARGFVSEGRSWLAKLLATESMATAAVARAKALNAAGVLAYEQSEYAVARSFYETSLVLRRELGDRQGVANLLNNLANIHIAHDDQRSARILHEESLAIRHELGDRPGVAVSLRNLALIAHQLSEYDKAAALYQEALSIQRELGDHFLVANLVEGLGVLAEDRGDFAAAYTLAEESLAIRRAIGDRPGIGKSFNNLGCAALRLGDGQAAREFQEQSLAIAWKMGARGDVALALESLAEVTLVLTDPERAACLWGAAERLREEIVVPLPQHQCESYARQVGAARRALGNDRVFSLAWQTGRAMSLQSAVNFALNKQEGVGPAT